jgi:predicted MFS family arabinose efflux permease
MTQAGNNDLDHVDKDSSKNENPKSTTSVIILFALAACAATTSFRICDPLLPVFAEEFGVRTAQASGTVTWFAIAYGIMQFFYGPVGDRYGKFRVVSWATLGCAIGALIVVFAPSLEVIEIGRLISGATAAAIVPLSMAWIGDHVPYEQRQATLARFLLGSISGMALGQLLGGIFADTIGWRWAFVWMAAVYFIVGGLLISRGRTVSEKPHTPSQGASILGPLKQVVSTRWAITVLVIVCIEGIFVFGPLAFVPAFLHERHGIPVSWAGMISGFFALGAFIYAIRANQFVSWLGERRLVLTGGITMAVAYGTFMFSTVWYWGVLASVLSGLGYYFLHAVLQTHATQMAPAARGSAVSLFASCLFLGQSLGVAACAWIGDSFGLSAVFPVGIVGLPLLAWYFARRLSLRQAAQARLSL